ncbi:M20 family metallopeptidase [Brachybacterium sp. YJGR34]|uniref:M20 metallopeptidase family protein n=1 Tax=Brachybacterium sp. YJGR34 TaxID=2059911 RepID=UPI000E0A5630|nr:M20 family metallopeptidase [Brachybacterium sp. YJGR34]
MAELAPGDDRFLTELVDLRRRLHAVPEIGLHLPLTRQLVLEALEGLGLEITLGEAAGSLVAVLRGGRPGPVVLLRADMDALPLVEETGLPFAATTGAMHACGHDLHMAGLVGAARLLAARREELPGDVLLMFQPGEEGHDGAAIMLREGLLEAAGSRPVAAYGVHVAADMPSGVVTTRPGTLMAGYSVLDVQVIGRGGHGSRPHEALDPVPATAEMISALYTHVARRYSAFDPVVLTVGEIHAGSAPNIIPEAAHFRAGVRSFSAATTDRLVADLPELVTALGRAHGLVVRATMRTLMPPTVNDADEAAAFAGAARRLFGEDRSRELEHPRAGSEDFSLVLAQIPGAYGYVGAARDLDPAALPPSNHSPRAVFDDSILADQALLLATLAWERLGRERRARG